MTKSLIGTLVGAYFIGVITDFLGCKPLLVGCVTLFSLSMLGAALAPTPVFFSAMRFIGGLGLGGVISAAVSLTVEYSPVDKRNQNFALMYSGYSLGALLSALLGIALLQSYGWRFVVGLGALPLLALPLAWKWLPESLDFLLSKGRFDQAQALALRLGINTSSLSRATVESAPKLSIGAIFAEVFSRENLWATICLWVAQVAGVMLAYGLGTWLPQLMRKLGYDLGPSLGFLAVFMLGSAIGGVIIGRIGDTIGTRKTIVMGYIVGALAVCGLTVKSGLLVNYVLVAIAGFGSIGVAIVQLGLVAQYYRPHVRASATGWAVGIGRFGAMGGPMLGSYLAAMPVAWNFFVFAGIALMAGLAIALASRRSE